MTNIDIIPVNSTHTQAILDIYNYYIKTSIITFELTEIDLTEMETRIERITKKYPFIVAVSQNQVLGYAYADKWRTRKAYDISVESTVYLNHEYVGKGVGTLLYKQLIKILSRSGFKNAIGGIALPNDASIALHEKCGFKKVAEFEAVGNKFDRAINVGYWQLKIDSSLAK